MPEIFDHMCYKTSCRRTTLEIKELILQEELLALSERMGHLKTKTFASSTPSQMEDQKPSDEKPSFCVICQMDFEDQEKIKMLDCRHEYHVDCIRKWLNVKNNCPICKSKALS
nr:hypothetical protein [Tanacetum cinerariifolium]